MIIKKLGILGMILCLSGCAALESNSGDQPLILMPPESRTAPMKLNKDEGVAFEDISLSSQKKLQAMTNQMAIEEQTSRYLSNGQADVISRPDGTILFPYGLAQVRVLARTMMYSKIILQEGEKIVSAASGDTARWQILPNYIGDASSYTPVILIKPLMPGLQTSLSIITDKRDYDITIQSAASGDYMPRVGFYYPQDLADAVRAGPPPDEAQDLEARQPKINIENIKYDYRISGNRRLNWYPASVFEDGSKVFIRMPEHVERSQLPVFMAVNPGGRKEVVNYRYFKPYFIIDMIFDSGVLILGTEHFRQVVKITRV